eukprot:CAMPEP_0172519534 /NCGR_PEP_ID=MMETSP1066-20121228/291477_1 /TAXON_ID=671091 /ORGANISM="Coscinodiscus wailesii, Strain CCMP2513" /LENGTH=337 /DNA_ID=CAMNT_0013302139 /DNA_START=1 /DNA_END=1012 /DNA_ORIENTATION=-
MPTFKCIALLPLLALSKTSDATQLRGQKYRHLEWYDSVTEYATPLKNYASKSSKDERMSTLDDLSSSFNSVKHFVSESGELSEERLKAIISKIDEFGGVFRQFESEMTTDNADGEEWEKTEGDNLKIDEFGGVFRQFESEMTTDNADGEEWEKLDDVKRAYREVIEGIVERGSQYIDNSASSSNDVSTSNDVFVNVDQERINALKKIGASFEDMGRAISGVPTNDQSKNKLGAIAYTLQDVGESFVEMGQNMVDKKASETEWSAFGDVLEDYRSIVNLLGYKIEAFTADTDTEDENAGGVPDAVLEDNLDYISSRLDSVETKEDLQHIEEVLGYVGG